MTVTILKTAKKNKPNLKNAKIGVFKLKRTIIGNSKTQNMQNKPNLRIVEKKAITTKQTKARSASAGPITGKIKKLSKTTAKRYNSIMGKKTDKARIAAVRQAIKALPSTPGLYFFKDAKETVLYIGKAKNLRSRAASYFQESANLITSRGPKIVEMANKTTSVDYLETPNEVDATLQEARLIKDIRPPYNTDLADDKSFPYLEITTRTDYPGVYITRNPQNEKSKLFGPFTAVSDLRAAMGVLQKIFKFRTCAIDIKDSDEKRKFFRPCLLYSIKQCAAPCGAKIEKAEYKKIIADLIKFLQSKRSSILRQLKKQMAAASKETNYESAAMYRDRIRLIQRLGERGTVEANVQPEVFARNPAEALEKLQKIFNSEKPIRIIEGIDIAHISGQQTVGSLVKFIDGKPFKSGYRRFKIKTVTGIDDYACIKEVVTRRYAHALQGEELWPDIILIDGGLGQLHAAEEAFVKMNAPMPLLASIAKKQELVYIHGHENPLKLPANNTGKKLLQYVRDEAHRFAQHYHHILRTKKVINGK